MKEFFNEFYLTDDKSEIMQHCQDVEELLKQSYWANSRNIEIIKKSIQNACCFAIFDSNRNKIVAFARVITDYTTLYCLEDVIVDEAYRKRGLGKRILEYITKHETKLQGQFGIVLTRDAQGLYSKYGFKEYYDTCMYKL